VLSQVQLEYTPSAIFVTGNWVAIFGTFRGYSYKNRNFNNLAYTFVKIYNVANRASPYLVREYQVAGTYFNGRMLNSGFVYLVSNFDFVQGVIPWCDWGSGKVDIPFNNIYIYPIRYQRVRGINILSFNLANPLNTGRKVVTVCAETANIMYMSENHIYLANTVIEGGLDYSIIRKIFVRGLFIVPFGDARVRGTINNQFSLD
jgi:hypothetical protein